MASKKTNRVRIVGGQWRGRKLPVAAVDGLRPTPDRVRETLFNWLQPFVSGATVLDLFAGSGVLGFEALSRGAARAELVEQNALVCQGLREHQVLLEAQAQIHESPVQRFLKARPQAFDIVFIDPPYASKLQTCVCELLQLGWLAKNALVYLESPASHDAPTVPENWSEYRAKIAGEVRFSLFQVLGGDNLTA